MEIASTAGGTQSFRVFSPALDATNQVTYIRFDFAETVPGNGNAWGGLAFFESDGTETFFDGIPGQFAQYGFDLKQGDALSSGIAVDDEFHTIIAEVDTTGAGTTDASYRIWVDNFNLDSPNATATINNNPIDAPWDNLRLAAEGAVTQLFDNLTIATTAAEVGLISVNATVTIDRSSGAVSLSSPTPVSNVVGYSLTSGAGSFNQANWTTVTDNYDEPPPGDGSFDADDDWTVLTEAGSTTDLSEMTFSTTPGDGGTIGTTPVDLGTPWERTPLEDVQGTLMIDDNGTPIPIGVNVTYTGSAIASGDLNGDGDINVDDWTSFKAGQGIVNNTMTLVEAYRLGDMDGDQDRDLTDFGFFKAAFEAENGVGSFDAMLASVPEPGGLALAVLGGALGCLWRRRVGQTLALAVVLILALSALPQPAHAVVFAEDDFSGPDTGTGWAAGSNWDNLMGGVSMTTAGNNEAFRTLATPLEPYNSDVLYIAFDFQAAQGNAWGGLAFFEDVGGGNETLFIGDPSQYNAYGYDLKQGDTLPANDAPDGMSVPTGGVMVDSNFHRIIAAIDFDDDGGAPFDDVYSLWVDNFDQNNPSYTVTIQNSPIINAWQSIRVGADGVESIKVDNLIITDQPELVFTPPALLELVVNKNTGDVTLSNTSGETISIDSYTIGSASGALNPGSATGDYNMDGSVDAADYVLWRRDPNSFGGDPDGYNNWRANFGSTGGEGGWNSLADQDLTGFPSGDGTGNGWEEGDNPSANQLEEYFLRGTSDVADGTSISLGAAYGGGGAGAEDVSFQYRSAGEVKTGLVSYVTSGSGASVAPEPAAVALAIFAAFAASFGPPRRRRAAAREGEHREGPQN